MSLPKGTKEQPVIKVVIVEDKTWLRENLEKQINQNPHLRCLKTYPTAELAIEDIRNVDPDVVIMDINLPKMDGVECVRRIKALRPELRCLMLTVYEEADRIFNSLLAGASGYLLKRNSSEELLEAIQQVSSGGSPMSSSIARKVVDYFNTLGAQKTETDLLSPREQQVLELLARGAAYKDIADQLSLSIETIRMNVKHIYAKLHVHSRGEAAAKYLRSRSLGGR
jgi:DNA-binding NarL/FixJ family response regulator